MLVVGGGPAGIGAALGAVQAGARVILAERYGFLGGNATAALVMPLMSFHTQTPTKERRGATTLLPTDHGPGEAVVGGALAKLLSRLVARRRRDPAHARHRLRGAVRSRVVQDRRARPPRRGGRAASVPRLCQRRLGDSKVEGVVFETKSGPLAIRAKVTIDCTGDADIAVQAGTPTEVGRADGLVQPMTLMFRMAEFQRAAFEGYVKENPKEWRGVHGLWDLVRKATAAGELKLPREDILFFATPHEGEVSVNSTRVTRVLGTDVWDLCYAEWMSRRQMRQIAEFLKRYVPGFEKSYVMQSGVNVGVRETRRIVGDYQLTADDVLSARKFDDGIARGSYPVDIHNPTGTGTVLKRLPPGEAYDIPLRCLMPQNAEGLIVAGRCMSGTHEAHSSYRVMPIVMATGQAAGVTAAIAARRGIRPRETSIREVQHELVRQGASLRRELRPAKAA